LNESSTIGYARYNLSEQKEGEGNPEPIRRHSIERGRERRSVSSRVRHRRGAVKSHFLDSVMPAAKRRKKEEGTATIDQFPRRWPGAGEGEGEMVRNRECPPN